MSLNRALRSKGPALILAKPSIWKLARWPLVRSNTGLITRSKMFCWGSPGFSAHLAARGTMMPGTTRCAMYGSPSVFHPHYFVEERSSEAEKDDPKEFVVCFVDVRIGEYIFGTGEPRLAVAIGWISLFQGSFDRYTQEEREIVTGTWASNGAAEFEGREFVMLLAPSPFVPVESWITTSLASLQRNAAGDIVTEYASEEEPYITLDELKRKLNTAHETRLAKTGGRTGSDVGTPMLITHTAKLKEFYVSIQAYERPIATPMPPPAVR